MCLYSCYSVKIRMSRTLLWLAPIVVSSDSSSESKEPSNIPVVPSINPTENSFSPTPLLLERLLALQQSELSHKRVIRQNSGGTSSRKKKPFCSTDPKSVMPVARVRETIYQCIACVYYFIQILGLCFQQ